MPYLVDHALLVAQREAALLAWKTKKREAVLEQVKGRGGYEQQFQHDGRRSSSSNRSRLSNGSMSPSHLTPTTSTAASPTDTTTTTTLGDATLRSHESIPLAIGE